MQQLDLAIQAVFRSWNTDRAVHYRRIEDIPDDLGTAVNVQTMVFGNMGDDSGSGVAFTRDPVSGEPDIWASCVISRVRTPRPLVGGMMTGLLELTISAKR